MNPEARAISVFEKAKRLGLEGPTEAMVQEAIHDAEFNAIMCPEFTAAQHGLPWPIASDAPQVPTSRGAKPMADEKPDCRWLGEDDKCYKLCHVWECLFKDGCEC